MIAGNTLFFVKGGLGILISSTGFSFIRSWNRLTPIIQILMIITAVYFIQNWTNLGKKWWFKITLGALILSQLQAFTTLSPTPQIHQHVNAQNYVNKISNVVQSRCAILQIPEISYPQNGNYYNMHDYDPFIVQITNNDFAWSYGSPKNAPTERRPLVNFRDRKALQALGFCGIDLDTFGTNSNETLTSLIEIYGPPRVKSEDGRHFFFSTSSSL